MPASDADPVIPQLHFSTAALARRDAAEVWHERVAGYYETLPVASGTEPFRIRTASWNLGEQLTVHARYSAREQARTPRKIRADQVDHYRLILQLEGVLRVDADGQRVQVQPGQLLLTDMSRPERYSVDPGSNIVLFLPRERLDAALPRPLGLHGVLPQGAAASLLALHLRGLLGQLGELRQSEAAPVARATLHLVAAALAPCARTLPLAQPAAEATLLRQACRHIEQHLLDEALSPQSLAAAFRVSRATLYRLFEPLGGVTAYIREQRLRRVHGLLAAPAQRHHLSTLAAEHGFSDASTLSRAFKQQFGYSPSEVRLPLPAAAMAPHAAAPPLAAGIAGWLRSLRG